MGQHDKKRLYRSAEAARGSIGPKQRWCVVCHCIVRLSQWQQHLASSGHIHGARKLQSLEALGKDMWAEYEDRNPEDGTSAGAGRRRKR